MTDAIPLASHSPSHLPSMNPKACDGLPSSPHGDTWALYGTLGCHLCEAAEAIVAQAWQVVDFKLETIDIADLPGDQALALATKIPVLVTPTRTLYYPFSLMDVVALAH